MGKGQMEIRYLTKEIDSIVSAPYAVLFKNLSHLLSKIDENSLYLWTVAKECQIVPLITRILGALSNDGSALSALLQLTKNRSIRNELIRQKPVVLSEFFSSNAEQHVHEATIVLCRHTFPENIALPAEYSDFVDSVLANRREHSLNIWVEELYNVVSSMPPTTLSISNEETIQRCAGLWNDAAKVADNMTFLRFISIAATVYRSWQSNEPTVSSDFISSPEPNALKSWAAKCSRLFVGDKAPKIIRSVLLRTLYCMSNRSERDNEEGLACLCMIRYVLETMDQAVLNTASSDQDTAQILVKLAQKASQESVFAALRLCACSILRMIDPEYRLWDITSLHSSFTQLLQSQLGIETSTATDRLALVQNLKFQRDHQEVFRCILRDVLVHESLCTDMMQYLTDWCRPGMYVTVEVMCSLHSAIIFADILHQLVVNDELSDELLKCLATVDLPDWWNWDFGSPARTINCCALEVCCHTRQLLQKRLANSISDIMITAACTTATRLSRGKYKMLRDVVSRYEPNTRTRSCSWSTETMVRENSNVRFGGLGYQTCPKPQEGLERILSSMSQQTLAEVSRYVDCVCRDLQHRCESVEAPLVAEQAKSASLQKELVELRNANEILLADQQARKISWQHCLDVEQERVAELRSHQTVLEQELEQAIQQLKEEATHLVSVTNAHDKLKMLCQSLRQELEQEQVNVQKCQEEYEQMAGENQNLLDQMHLAQQKEHKMLCVLRGNENNV